jgi:hypothetical protein
MQITKKKLKFSAIILLCTLFLFLIIALIFKQSIFNHFLNSKIESFNTNHSGTISIEEAKLNGITNVVFNNIIVFPETGDTLIKIDSINADLKFWDIIFGDVNFSSLTFTNFKININIADSTDNFSFLLKNNSTDPNDTIPDKDINYHKRSNIIFNALFGHIPDFMTIQNLNIFYKHDKDSLIAKTIDITYNENIFKSRFNLDDGKYKSEIRFVGKILPDTRTAAIKVNQVGKENKIISGLMNTYKTDLSFDTAFFSFIQTTSGGYVNLLGKSYLRNFKVNQPSISKTDVKFENLKFDFNIRIGENYFQLDSISTAYINTLSFNPFINYTTSPTKQLTLKIHKPFFTSQQLFESLPEGLFHTLYGIKTKGELAYNLDFFVDLSIPDSLKFNSEMLRKDFGIKQFGNVNYSMIQNEFTHTAFENGEPVKTFSVGFSNPSFTPLNLVSPYMRNAILCTEDGAFFYHRGFIMESIQQAIAEDIKRKKFARGGSTISMQLVKNIFLNRNKTIARKVEEIIIVWLIENQGLCTKERMYEVYLNIIEWGPGIYGIADASKFYFNKRPADLSLAEAIYLASIIPKPKYFKYSFDANGELNASVKEFIVAIANKMLNKNMINAAEQQSLNTSIVISGEAKSYIVPTDSMQTFEPLEFNIPN